MIVSSTPFDWFTDPVVIGIIGIVSLILTLIGIIIAFWLYQKGKQLRLITYKILSDTPVVSIKRQIGKGKIKIEYEESNGHIEEISDASLLTLQVWNSGNTDIRIWNTTDTDIEDLEEPIEFTFNERTVVSLTKVEALPQEGVILQRDLDKYLNKQLPTNNSLGLPRCLLKPGQSIILSVLLKGEGREIKTRGKLLNGEIRNFNELIRERTRTTNIIANVAIGFLCLMAFCLILVLQLNGGLQGVVRNPLFDYVIFTTVCSLLLWWWLLYRITNPFKCTCGFRTPFSGRFKKHVLQAHIWA